MCIAQIYTGYFPIQQINEIKAIPCQRLTKPKSV